MSNQYFQYKGFYTFSYELILIRIKVHVINAFSKYLQQRFSIIATTLIARSLRTPSNQINVCTRSFVMRENVKYIENRLGIIS